MEYLKVFLYVVEVVVCLLLGLIVMLQKPKEGGLGGAFGGGALEASLGADAGNVLIKATSILGAIFLINTLAYVQDDLRLRQGPRRRRDRAGFRGGPRPARAGAPAGAVSGGRPGGVR